MPISENMVQEIVQEVMAKMQIADAPAGKHGVFKDMNDAIEAAKKAQLVVKTMSMDQREKIITCIRKKIKENAEVLARMGVEETGMGNVGDKILKHHLVADKTPGTEDITTTAWSGDRGLTLIEMGPFGVIGAITPSKNPTETIINNTISMIGGGNAVVFNVHPGAKKVCAVCLQILHRTIVENGGPANLITMQREPDMEAVNKLTASPKIRLMVGTGGMGMVNALLKSGKKTIGAGAGNPPVVVDDTADLDKAASEIYRGASFDNNLLCLAEKETFVMDNVADELIRKMCACGAHLITPQETEQLLKVVFLEKDGKYSVNKKWVGKDASLILESIGIKDADTRLVLCEVPHDHPFVLVEQLMPIMPIVRCKTFEDCVKYAVVAENGNRHTASMFSKNVDHMTRFAKEIETTIFTKNAATLVGVGIGGEGHTTMTIAGPTGEGLTCARSFTRRRRCMLADGGLRVI